MSIRWHGSFVAALDERGIRPQRGRLQCIIAALLTFIFILHSVAQTNQPAIFQNVGFDQKLGSQIPLDAEFRDSDGQVVKLEQYFGKRPVILTLVYFECPMLCTLVLNGVVSSLRVVPLEIGKDYDLLTISFNYKETHVLAKSKKENYLREFNRPGAEQAWHFLVGSSQAIDRVANAAGFQFVFDPESDQFAHASGIMVLTPQGQLSKYFYGVEYSARDLRLGLVEAGQGKIGSAVDKFLLYCYHYDPASGQYGLAIMNVVRAACLVTLLTLVGFIASWLRRDRKKA